MIRPRFSGHGSITEGVIWKQLLRFFFPILLGTFFQQLYNTADAIIVGNFVGTEALAAVGGATGNVINLIVGFFVGLASGATVILAQFYGARQNDNVSRAVHTAIALALFGGIVLMIAGLLLTPSLLRMMDTPGEVMLHAVPYMRIYFAGMVPSLIYNIGSGLLRATGDSKRPLYFLIASCFVNIVLDIFLVVGAKMGTSGAALATIFSQSISAAMVILALVRTNASYKLDFKKIRLHFDLLKNIVRIGLPAGIQSILYTISNLLIQSTINSFGTSWMASWTAYGKLDSMFWMISNAFGISITTFVGQNFGAKKYDRVKRSVIICGGMYILAAFIVSGILYLFSGWLYALFTTDRNVIDQGIRIVKLLTPFYFTYAFVEVLACALRGTGDAVMPMLFTLFGICVLRMIWILVIAPSSQDLLFTLLCYPITWAFTGTAFTIYYFKGNWFKRCVRKQEALGNN